APFDHHLNGIDEVIHVDERLAMGRAAGIEATGEAPLVDPLNLVRERNRVAEIVIDAGYAEQHGRDIAALLADDLLRADLRFRIGPGRLQWPVFIDELSRLGGAMHEHRAREHELLDHEAELAQSP